MKKLLAVMLLCAASLCAMGQTTQRATQFLAGNGSCGTPGFAFQGGTNDGLFWDSGNARVTVCVGGVDKLDVAADFLGLPTASVVKWSTDTGLSRDAAGVIDVGNGTAGSKTGKVILTTLGLAGGGTVSDDGGNGINFFGSGGTGWELTSAGRLFGSAGKDINFQGATSGFTSLIAAAVASGTATLPTGTGTLALTPTLTAKKGSGSGSNYNSASTTYVVVDATNLCLTVTVPTGWKLDVTGIAEMESLTAAVNVFLALTDNAACATANAGIIYELLVAPTSTSTSTSAVVGAIINGDGAVHNVALQFKTTNGADSVVAVNATTTRTPIMKFNLTPSN